MSKWHSCKRSSTWRRSLFGITTRAPCSKQPWQTLSESAILRNFSAGSSLSFFLANLLSWIAWPLSKLHLEKTLSATYPSRLVPLANSVFQWYKPCPRRRCFRLCRKRDLHLLAVDWGHQHWSVPTSCGTRWCSWILEEIKPIEKQFATRAGVGLFGPNMATKGWWSVTKINFLPYKYWENFFKA